MNNDASWMKEDVEKDETENEDEDEEEDLLLTSKEPFRMIAKLIWAEFTVFKKTRPYTRQHQLRAGGQGQYGT